MNVSGKRERKNLLGRQHYWRHRDEISKRRKLRRLNDLELAREKDRASREQYVDRRAGYYKKWRLKNLEYARAQSRRWYWENRERAMESRARWKRENQDSRLAQGREMHAKLRAAYEICRDLNLI